MSSSLPFAIEIRDTQSKGDGVFSRVALNKNDHIFSERTKFYAYRCIPGAILDQVEDMRHFKYGMGARQIPEEEDEDHIREPHTECLTGMLAHSMTHIGFEFCDKSEELPDFGTSFTCSGFLCQQNPALHSYLQKRISITRMPLSEQKLAVALFDYVPMINHSCDPNAECIISIDFVSVRAIKNIAPGEEITISYIHRILPSVPFTQRMVASRFGKCLCNTCIISPYVPNQALPGESPEKFLTDTEFLEQFETVESCIEMVTKELSGARIKEENILERATACFAKNYDKMQLLSQEYVKPPTLAEYIFEALAFSCSENDEVYLKIVTHFKQQLELFSQLDSTRHICYLIAQDICKRSLQLGEDQLFYWAYNIINTLREFAFSQDPATNSKDKHSLYVLISIGSVEFLHVILAFVKHCKTISICPFPAESDDQEWKEMNKRSEMVRRFTGIVRKYLGQAYVCYVDYLYTSVVREFLESISATSSETSKAK